MAARIKYIALMCLLLSVSGCASAPQEAGKQAGPVNEVTGARFKFSSQEDVMVLLQDAEEEEKLLNAAISKILAATPEESINIFNKKLELEITNFLAEHGYSATKYRFRWRKDAANNLAYEFQLLPSKDMNSIDLEIQFNSTEEMRKSFNIIYKVFNSTYGDYYYTTSEELDLYVWKSLQPYHKQKTIASVRLVYPSNVILIRFLEDLVILDGQRSIYIH
jgi:hypothetical protein